MTEALFLTADDTVNTIDPESDTVRPSADPTCVECGVPLEWSGKGFRPKYCAEHRSYRQKGKSGRPPGRPRKDGAPAGSAPSQPASRNNAAVNRAIQSLELLYGMIGTGLAMSVAPSLGREVIAKREDLAESYRMLLETDKRFREWFGQVEGKAAWLPIIVVHGDLIVNALLSRQMQAAAKAQAQTDSAEYTQPFEYSNGQG